MWIGRSVSFGRKVSCQDWCSWRRRREVGNSRTRKVGVPGSVYDKGKERGGSGGSWEGDDQFRRMG